MKESAEKAKRQKTVIVGDMKPIIDSLDSGGGAKKKSVSFVDDPAIFKLSDDAGVGKPSKKEMKQKMAERELSKSIPKQSIRVKQS